jgi:2-hydroxychromene-2-carboxylate isomerase
MQPTLDFYFDFSSPYSYIGANLIGPVAERFRRAINWRPILLGAAFQKSGQRPLVEIPIKGDYSRRDFERSAHFHDLPYRHPPSFPIATVNTARAVLVVQARDPEKTGAFVVRALRAYFAENRAINEPAVIGEIATELGLDAAAITAAIREPAIKEQLKHAVDEGITRGVFGAPFMFVDGEPFWGHDRIAQVERWLSSGPF